MKRHIVFACTAFSALACSSYPSRSNDGENGPLVRAISASPTEARHWAARFSVATQLAPCETPDSLAANRCPERDGSDARLGADIARRIRSGRAGTPDADALQATALVDLLSGDTTGNTIERSISLLEMSTRLAPTAGRYTDLAAARLAYVSSRGGAKALVEALDAVGRALDRDSTFPPALYDRALALDRLGLDLEAAKAWRGYLKADSTSLYSTEARERLRGLKTIAPIQAPATDAPTESFRRFAHDAPGDAQLFAWDSLLTGWGASTLQGDSAAARARLDRADAIGGQLEHDSHDLSVLRAVRAIRDSRRDVRRTRSLATAHQEFGKAQGKAHVNAYMSADTAYSAILLMQPASPALMDRVSLAHANALIYARQVDRAQRATERFLARHDGIHEPLLHGRAEWYVGVLQLRKGHSEAGLTDIATSRGYYERSGDVESVAGTMMLESEVSFQSENAFGGYERGSRALRMLRGRPSSLWRHNALQVLSRATTRAGLVFASRSIDDEDAQDADHDTRLVSVIEARLTRARSAWRGGHDNEARRAAAEASAIVPRIADSTMRTQLMRDVSLISAQAILTASPDSAVALLTSAVAFDLPLHYPIKLVPDLVARAAAYAALGRSDRSQRDLSDAAALYDSARVALRNAALQAGVTTQARGVYDSLVMLRVRAKDHAGALAALERSRVTFLNFTRKGGASEQVPFDGSIIDYALIGDRLLSWTVTAHDTAFHSAHVDRAELSARIERVRSGLELGASEDILRADLGKLHELLIAPVIGNRTSGRLRVIVDGELSAVPFAALWNTRTHRYLVEDFVSSLAPTLSDAEMDGGTSGPFNGRAVIVASPALAGTQFRTMASLSGARDEARAIGAYYQGATVIRDTDADSGRVLAALGHADLFHFAGHAVLDDAQPWRSVLVVGPHGLTAARLATMDLRHVRLVVLSACETMRAPSGDVGGFAGLAASFVAAGVGGVIGSLWQVDDADAAKLMTAFHAAYRGTGDAAGALRSAQMSFVKTHRSPSTWSAFQYVAR